MDSSKHASWLLEYFPLISGIILTLWWALVRLKRSIFSYYVTHEQLDARLKVNNQYIATKIDYLTDQQKKNEEKRSAESVAIRNILLAQFGHGGQK